MRMRHSAVWLVVGTVAWAGSGRADTLPAWSDLWRQEVPADLPGIDSLFSREAPAPAVNFHWHEVGPAPLDDDREPIDPLAAAGLKKGEDQRRRAGSSLTAQGLRLDSNVVIDDPSQTSVGPGTPGRSWQTEESLRVEVAGPLFVFGQANAASQSVEQQRLNMSGRTGVGVRWQPWTKAEVQVRGGPLLRYTDGNGTPEEMARLALELTARTPVYGNLKFEYSGTAMPALSPLAREQLSQDLRLALHLSDSSQVHVGTRYSWQDTGAATLTPWTDRMQLYMGLQLKR
jgi:hypothetical protein